MRVVAAALLVLLITGCGSASEAVKPTPLKPIESTLNIAPAWSKGFSFKPPDPFAVLYPVVGGNRIYLADPKGYVLAVSAESGRRIWRRDIKKPISGGLGFGGGYLYGGTTSGEVFALNAEDGSIVWRRQVSSEVLSPPRAASGILVVRALDDQVYGFDARDGEQRWLFKRETPALTLHGTSAPVLTDDKAIIGLADGKLVAVGLFDGRLLWETRIAEPKGRSELEHMVDIDSDPLIIDDEAYAVTYQGRAADVDLQTGRQLWSREFSAYLPFALSGDELFIVDDHGNIWALDRRTGATLWKQDKLSNRRVTSPAVFGDYVVVGDFEGYVHWLDVRTGRIVGRYRVGDKAVTVPPFVGNDLVYVLDDDGRVSALKVFEKH